MKAGITARQTAILPDSQMQWQTKCGLASVPSAEKRLLAKQREEAEEDPQ